MNWKTGLRRLNAVFIACVWMISLAVATQAEDPAREIGSTIVYLVIFTCVYRIAGFVFSWVVRGFTDRGAT